MKPATIAFASALAAAAPIASPAQAATFTATGASAADIQGTVDDFRDALGTLNAFEPANHDQNGRRQINWDAAPDAISDPNPFPGDFFNGDAAPRARGIEFAPAGATTGFALSSTEASGQPVEFGFANDFTTFSPERLFTPVGGTAFDVLFFDPADQTTPTTTRGLGVVFTDVESDASTMSFFDSQDQLIETLVVPQSGNAGLSFAGVALASAEIARVRINSGSAPFLSNGSFGGGGDAVVMDDFIFGEPQASDTGVVPLPAPAALLASALGLMMLRRRRA
ncbi:MAG: hypothetical protein ACFBWO_11335 [Paracoccaceae bacterium]